MNILPLRAPDRDPSGDDILAAMGGLGRNDHIYIEVGPIAVYRDPDWDETVDGSTSPYKRGAWLTHIGTSRTPYSTLTEALIEALKEVEALI